MEGADAISATGRRWTSSSFYGDATLRWWCGCETLWLAMLRREVTRMALAAAVEL